MKTQEKSGNKKVKIKRTFDYYKRRLLGQSLYSRQRAPQHKRLIRFLYSRFINEIYIPDGSIVRIYRKPQAHKKEWGRISSILIRGNEEKYIFPDFNNIWEDTNGIIYENR